MNILQIIPATGWLVCLTVPGAQGKPEQHLRIPVVCFALVETYGVDEQPGEGLQSVIPFIVDEDAQIGPVPAKYSVTDVRRTGQRKEV